MAIPYILIIVFVAFAIKPYLRNDKTGIYCKNGVLYGRRLTRLTSSDFALIIAYFVYIFFAVFKTIGYGIGAYDAYAYSQNFANADTTFSNFFNNVTSFEPGYSLIVWVVRQLTSNYCWMLFIWYTLTFILLVHYLKHTFLNKHSFFPLMLILTMLISVFNTLRISVSIAIALNALILMKKEKWILSLIVIFLSISIHVSAIIMIPVFFAVWICTHIKSYKKSALIIIIVAGITASSLSLGLMQRVILASGEKSVYIGQSAISYGTYFTVIVFFILSILKFSELKSLNDFNVILIYSLPLCLICIPLQYSVAVMYRLTLYFIPIIFSLIPSVQKCYSNDKRVFFRHFAIISSYGYMIIRAVNFISEEIQHFGDYSNTLFK